MRQPRIALLALEALPNAGALRRFVAAHRDRIAFVGLSNPMRRSRGGTIGQLRSHLACSGPRFVPYLAVNFAVPDALRPLARWSGSPAATPLRRLCESLEVPVATIDDINGVAGLALLREADPDLVLTFHFDQVLSAEAIDVARVGSINVHPSLLPRHRGPVPTIHALAEGGAFGVSVHRTEPRIDAGAILAQTAVSLPPGITATRAAIRCHEAALPLLDDILGAVARTGRLPEGRRVEPLPYARFPSRELLASMARSRLRLVDGRDVADALALKG